jgi:hypothetical protein
MLSSDLKSDLQKKLKKIAQNRKSSFLAAK